MEVPQAIGGGSPNVFGEALKLGTSRFALGKDMKACREVLRSVALLGEVEEPRRLLSFMVALELGSKKWLVGHFPDSGPAPPQRLMLLALVAEVSEVENRQLNGGPKSSPKVIHVTRINRATQDRVNIEQMSIDVSLLHVQKLRMLGFVGLHEKAIV